MTLGSLDAQEAAQQRSQTERSRAASGRQAPSKGGDVRGEGRALGAQGGGRSQDACGSMEKHQPERHTLVASAWIRQAKESRLRLVGFP